MPEKLVNHQASKSQEIETTEQESISDDLIFF
ncbi:MAG: hypothetical protein ACJAWS_003368 [Oleiphilaceae bacterium]|jgi:hypothetical protein